jgi:hypothetical protein
VAGSSTSRAPANTAARALDAAEAREISLRPLGQGRRTDREVSASGHFEVASAAIGEFLGENWSRQRVHRCLQVLDKLGGEATETFAGTTPTMAAEIVKSRSPSVGRRS